MKNKKFLLKAFVLALLGIAPAVHGSSFTASPVKLTLSARDISTSVKVTNGSDKPLVVRINLYEWTKKDGVDQLTPVSDMVITPPIVRIAPRAVQVVRVGRPMGVQAPEIEKAYWLEFAEVPVPAQQTAKTDDKVLLKSLLKLRIPLFVTPTQVSRNLAWSLDRAASGNLSLAVFNSGTAHSKISKLRLLGADNKPIAEYPRPLYALPRQQARVELVPTRKPEKGESLVLEYAADHAPKSVEFKAPGL